MMYARGHSGFINTEYKGSLTIWIGIGDGIFLDCSIFWDGVDMGES